MRLQAISAAVAFASLVAFAGSAWTMSAVAPRTRVTVGVALALVATAMWFTVGWEAELQGVKQCFGQK